MDQRIRCVGQLKIFIIFYPADLSKCDPLEDFHVEMERLQPYLEYAFTLMVHVLYTRCK